MPLGGSRKRRCSVRAAVGRVNAAAEHATELSEVLRGIPVKINLIAMNPVAGSELRAASTEAVLEFQRVLAARGYSCFVRARRGDELDAACGQLARSDRLARAVPAVASS